MKAVILAAGKGTRMGELTAHVPKPMKEVRGKPILEHIVQGLRDEAGIRDFFIITGWCGHVIRDYFGDGARFNASVFYGEQVVQDGTGKAPELAKEWIDGDKFLLMYGFMIDLVEKAPVGQVPKNAFYNAGIYLLTPRVFDFTAKLEKSPRNEYEFTDALRGLYKSGARIRGVTLQGDWADVRDPKILAELNSRAK